jgi:hypothetical protein
LPHQRLVTFQRTMQRPLTGDAKLRQKPSTETGLKEILYLTLISFATISRVHKANANLSCIGFFCVTVL